MCLSTAVPQYIITFLLSVSVPLNQVPQCICSSVHMFLITSVRTSVHLYLSTAVPQNNCTSKHLYLRTLVPQYFCASVHLYISTPVHLYLSTPVHQYICTSVHLVPGSGPGQGPCLAVGPYDDGRLGVVRGVARIGGASPQGFHGGTPSQGLDPPGGAGGAVTLPLAPALLRIVVASGHTPTAHTTSHSQGKVGRALVDRSPLTGSKELMVV